MPTIYQLIRRPRQRPIFKTTTPALRYKNRCNPQKRGVCVKVYITKPKKPNSAQRKIAKVKLSSGRFTIVYLPGQGHHLAEHSVVLIRGGRVPDLPGVHYRAIRGKYDFVAKENFERRNRRSKFSVSKPK